MIQTKFGFHWSSTFRGEDFWKSLRRTTDDDDGRQVMRIAHMTLWVRWANNILSNNVHQFYNPTRVKPWHRILSVSSVFCVVLWGLSEDSYQVTFRLFSCFEFWCLRFCQKSNYQVTFRLFSCFEFLSEEQLPGDISSVFLFWVLVFEVLSEECYYLVIF
jgi:hypothetical protein